MSGPPPDRLRTLVARLRRYPVGAVHVAPGGVAALARSLGDVAGAGTLDVLDGLEPGALDVLLDREAVARIEAPAYAGPALVVHAEALWAPLAPRALGGVWRALALSEAPPAPRVVVVHSPLFVDRLGAAFDRSPQPGRLLRLAD